MVANDDGMVADRLVGEGRVARGVQCDTPTRFKRICKLASTRVWLCGQTATALYLLPCGTNHKPVVKFAGVGWGSMVYFFLQWKSKI
eukprot:scaffold5017_cov171-Amphora_coffeaeformis.AAC.24